MSELIRALDPDKISLRNSEPEITDIQPIHKAENETRIFAPRQAPESLAIPDQAWRKWSYTALSSKPGQPPPVYATRELEEYEKFIFEDLHRGSHAGDMLHFLFENLVFNDESYWDQTVKKLLQQYGKQYEKYAPHLPALIRHVVNAEIPFPGATFSLAGLPVQDTLREMEFNFMLAPTSRSALQELLKELPYQYGLAEINNLDGFLNGFIDLFFMHEGKYYILDWKSNFLGNTADDYAPDQLPEVMSRNNYHLQYLIYTLAIHKYLKSRLNDYNYARDFGGVIYVFLRGVRSGSSDGIFTYKVPEEILLKLETLLRGDEVII